MLQQIRFQKSNPKTESFFPTLQNLPSCYLSQTLIMASNVLPQALYMMPRNPALSSSSKLGFTSFVVSRQNSPSVSLVSQNWFSSSRKLSNWSFIVRADENSESVAVETVEEVEPEIEKPLRKPTVKLGDIMGILNRQAVEARDEKRPIPDLRAGDIVEIKKEVPNKRRRFTIYKGIVMSKQNAGIHTTVRIRRIIAGIGVEIVFPIYSPMIMEIKVIKHRKVRRARLYYLRDKLPRFSTFK